MPVDFKLLTEKIQSEKGRCLLPEHCYDWVDGHRIDCNSGERKDLKIYYRIDDGHGGKCFQILNGVTGYESFYVHDLLQPKSNASDHWVACAMTKNRWDGLYVNYAQVVEKLKFLHTTSIT